MRPWVFCQKKTRFLQFARLYRIKEKAVWGDAFYVFWAKQNIFIALESQFFRSPLSMSLMAQELEWLEETFSQLPTEVPKTIMMHVPLFIDNADETDSDASKLC